MKDIIEQFEEVWGGSSDFSEGGVKYVNAVIEKQLREIEEEDYALESVKKEYADIALVVIRELYELDLDYIKQQIELTRKGLDLAEKIILEVEL